MTYPDNMNNLHDIIRSDPLVIEIKVVPKSSPNDDGKWEKAVIESRHLKKPNYWDYLNMLVDGNHFVVQYKVIG